MPISGCSTVEELLRLLLHEKRRDGPIDWVDVIAMGEEDGDWVIWVSASGSEANEDKARCRKCHGNHG